MAPLVTYILGIVMGVVLGFFVAAPIMNDSIKENYTSNQYLYEQKLDIQTKAYKVWKINYEAEQAIKEVK